MTDEHRPPGVDLQENPAGGLTAVVHGAWRLGEITPRVASLRKALVEAHARSRGWDLSRIDALDSAGALLLWQGWARRFPERLALRPEHRRLIESRVEAGRPSAPAEPSWAESAMNLAARASAVTIEHSRDALDELGRLFLDGFALVLHPHQVPWREISATIYHAGVTALGITGLIGALIGVVLAYQSALQLQQYGGEIYIVDMLGYSIVRELGPMLAAILVAGRSGSSMTAQLGVMRVTEELDAMTVLGISVNRRLILPRVVGLIIALPLLTIWTNIMAVGGGMVAAWLALDIPFEQFLGAFPESLPIVNLWLGLGKAGVFGALIAMTATHFGLRVQPNTRSLAAETTKAVVAAITLVVALDGAFSVVFQDIGF